MSEEQAVTSAADESGAVQAEEVTPNPEQEAEASATTEGGTESEGEQATETDSKKKDAQERIRQEIERRKAEESKRIELENRLAQLESQVKQPKDAPFRVDAQKFGEYIAQLRDNAENLRLEGRHAEALETEIHREELIREYKENQKKLAAWEQQQKQQQLTQQQAQQRDELFNRAAGLYREQNNIPEKTWKDMGDWFVTQMESDKLLQLQFQELAQKSIVSAIDFAHSKAKAHFEGEARKAAEAKKAKDAAKGSQIGAGGADGKGIKSFSQLMGLGSSQVKAFRESNPKEYQRLLDAHLKK